ncbi:hypothetical protein OZX56_06910 [Lactobacillus sp. ESL0684]|uniref:hypothetical protein n=1 Tax=unclassified Lactobacillus TaxID=2620435 RepID=UPI0023F93184|nr:MULTISPECIES: hypothetical protein [unclassified Lactobacillus]WEV40214.1 hypothetical protein OZX59_08555 [Lactobacillus sp. ESL0681]WEV43261.1 hypothetical protein OZX56_06910 [Lactobacillus sp. ESL0684]
MWQTFLLIIGLLIIFLLANKVVSQVYLAGHKIYSVLVGLLSILLLAFGIIYCKNSIGLTLIGAVFVFGCIVFLNSFDRNIKTFMHRKDKQGTTKEDKV